MRGFKLLGTAALAVNDCSLHRPESRSLVLEPLKTIDEPLFGRRKALLTLLAGAASFPSVSSALDIEAFANSELDKDQKNCNPKFDPKCAPKLTQDEALCKYGQSGNARGEACKRVKQAGGELPQATKERSLGGAYAI